MTTRRTGDYDNPNLQYKSTEPDQRIIGIDDVTRGYIMLPIWVADKIELSGHRLSDFFSDVSWQRGGSITPDVPPGTKLIDYKSCDSWGEKSKQQAAKMLQILSFEDLADIGFLHYLMFAAFHKMNPLCGLATDLEGGLLAGSRNHAVRSRGGDTHKVVHFGSVDIHSSRADDYLIERPADFEFDIMEGCFSGAPEFGSSLTYWPMSGKSHIDIINYAVERFYAIAASGGPTTRIRRTGDLVSFANAGNSTVIIPSIATVLNVATLLAQDTDRYNDDDGTLHRISQGGIDATKEQMVVLVEEILSELKRHGDNQYLAREGLILLYTRVLN